MKILIIEDDLDIVDTIKLIFEISWPEVKFISTTSGTESMELVKKELPDAVILDLGLPDMDGIDVLQHIRQFSYVPVIILTARTQPDSIVKGLEAGADDYLTKPFDPMVLIARIKNLLRRINTSGGTYDKESLIIGDLTINFALHEVILRGNRIKLTSTEWSLLNYLVINEGKIVSYKELWEKVWGSEFLEDFSALRTCVWRLRGKLGDDGTSISLIESYRSMGYRFARSG